MRRGRAVVVACLVVALSGLLGACGAAPEYYAESPSPSPPTAPDEAPASMAFDRSEDAASAPMATPTPTPRLPGRPDPNTELILALVRLGLTRVEAECVADAIGVAAMQPGDMPDLTGLGPAAAACGMDQERLAEIARPG
jgi:hypothetical protein